jgi:hypothetical protein
MSAKLPGYEQTLHCAAAVEGTAAQMVQLALDAVKSGANKKVLEATRRRRPGSYVCTPPPQAGSTGSLSLQILSNSQPPCMHLPTCRSRLSWRSR